MRNILIILLLFSSFAVAQSDDWKKTIASETALKAVQLFKSDPLGPDADGALAVIANYAENSDAVTVKISPKYLPWEPGSLDEEISTKLLGAYISGNLEYQLKNQINLNSPIEGTRLVLYTYQVLRSSGKITENEKFEEWITLDKNGQLASKIGI
jgi:hypothetical protein